MILSVVILWRSNPIFHPSGRLRESRKGAERADAVIVTKSEREDHFPELEKLNKPYFQTTVEYANPVNFFGKEAIQKVLIVTGLADNSPFIHYVSNKFEVVDLLQFSDHHNYQKKDLNIIIELLEADITLITTEKDFVKLKQFEELRKFNCAYIPIKVKFSKDEERFLQMVDESLKDYKLYP